MAGRQPLPSSPEHASKEAATAAEARVRIDRWAQPAVIALVAGCAAVLVAASTGNGFGAFAQVVLALIWAMVWALAVAGAGRPVVRALSPEAAWDLESQVLTAVSGSAVLIGCAAALSAVGWFRPWPLLAVVVGWAAVGTYEVVRRPPGRVAVGPGTAALLALALLALAVAATISVFYDQWHQHLGFPWIWLQDGSIHALERNWYSYMPVNASLLFAYGLDTLGPWSAQVVHWFSGLVTVAGAAALARRASRGSTGMWAAVILATSPTLLHLATTAGSDLVLTMFAAGAWLALLRAAERPAQGGRWWIVAGACVGLAVGTKYTAIGMVALPMAGAAVVLATPLRSREAARRLTTGGVAATLTALLVFAPWGVRNLMATGNPFFPFVNGLFRRLLVVPWAHAHEFESWLSGVEPSVTHVLRGLDLGVFGHSLDGFPSTGLPFLALLPVLVVAWGRLRHPAARAMVTGAVLGIAFWTVSMHANRYLLPALLPAAAVLGGGVESLLAAAPRTLRRGSLLLLALLVVWNLGASVSSVGVQRLACTLGVERVQPILSRWVSSSPAFAAVAELPADAKVLLVAESRALGFARPVVLEHPFGEPYLEELARTSASCRDMARRLTADGITHLLANRWEARRIAAMGRRDRYFQPAAATTARRLDQFSRQCLAPVWTGRGLGLYRLVPDCSAPSPGAGDLASW